MTNAEARFNKSHIRKVYACSSRDSNPRPFNHESGALTTELSPPPTVCTVCVIVGLKSDREGESKCLSAVSVKVLCENRPTHHKAFSTGQNQRLLFRLVE